jgi:hypothetical protein
MEARSSIVLLGVVFIATSTQLVNSTQRNGGGGPGTNPNSIQANSQLLQNAPFGGYFYSLFTILHTYYF